MLPVVLMIAEKPSVAETIAQKLSSQAPRVRKALNGIPVHEWDGSFANQRVMFRMTAVTGHVYGMDFPSKYNSWDKVDPADLFECPTVKTEANEKQKVPIMLKAESRNTSYVILWLDCDKEGENICFEITDILCEHMRLAPGQNLFRARFSALTTPDLKRAMETLTVPNENESKSVDARQELDLRIGCCFTRFQTKIFHGKYGSLDSALISYGPCQTPTLGFCVKRHDIIQQFKPEKFWTIRVSVILDAEKDVSLSWSRNRLFDKEAAEYFLNSIKESKTAKVTDCTKKECAKKRPVGLNTVEMLRLASSRLGFSPHHTMQVAERLYTQGYISYPRTETTHYPANFDYRSVLSKFSSHDQWSQYVTWDSIVQPLKGHDAGDHSPITPLVAVNSSVFHDSDAAKLYEFVLKYFISTVTEDCIYLETNITFKIQNETFTFCGKEIIKPGFTKVYPFSVISSDDQIPQVTVNSSYPISEKKITESETKPPDYLTESELISMMETHGIGTDASIPVHINNICQRNYVKLIPGRKLQPTELGIILVHGYLKIDPELVLPTMRAELEKQLELIAKGSATIGPVVQHTVDIFKAKFLYFVKNIGGMDELFEVSFSKHADSGKPFSRCGKCRRYMKLVLNRLHCQVCQDTYSVPSDGTLRAFNDLRCPLDDFELVEFSSGKSYIFCPYCINNPPFDGMKKGNGCNNCSHPSCVYGFNSKTIAQCAECEQGLMVLDPASGPKWKISCNKCNVFLSVQCKKLSVLEETCGDCSSQCVAVDDKKGCLYCTEEFEANVEMHRLVDQRRGGRGGGRGRGREISVILLLNVYRTLSKERLNHSSGRESGKFYHHHPNFTNFDSNITQVQWDSLVPGGSQSWSRLPQFTKRNGAVQACGSRLVEMVKGLCRSHSGVFSGFNRRSDSSMNGLFSDDSQDPNNNSNDLVSDYLSAHYGSLDSNLDKDVDNSFSDLELLWPNNPKSLAFKILTESKAHQRFRRNISDECCKKPCSVNDMVKYCGGGRRIAAYQ
ncbi:unnamed protein product [Allacma fusca]|uniref:DNA topoisomerase n=1 Tax=Allacma fusca TaxID=39272 RepID=A0A8J2KLK4_9HEXA|nr:unnamed protein product [Allacma fusca]